MELNPKDSDRRLHTCEDCTNIHFLEPSPDGYECRRCGTALNAHGSEYTNAMIRFYTRFCTACARLSKHPTELKNPCILCDNTDCVSLVHDGPT